VGVRVHPVASREGLDQAAALRRRQEVTENVPNVVRQRRLPFAPIRVLSSQTLASIYDEQNFFAVV
jgi:hypothetical protein